MFSPRVYICLLAAVATAASVLAQISPKERVGQCESTFYSAVDPRVPVEQLNPATLCGALYALSTCVERVQSEAGNTTDVNNALMHAAMQHNRYSEINCSTVGPLPQRPRINSENNDMVLTVDEQSDIKMLRHRREVVSLWDMNSRINALTDTVSTTMASFAADQLVQDNRLDSHQLVQDKRLDSLEATVAGRQGPLATLQGRVAGLDTAITASGKNAEQALTQAAAANRVALDLTSKVGALQSKSGDLESELGALRVQLELVRKSSVTTADLACARRSMKTTANGGCAGYTASDCTSANDNGLIALVGDKMQACVYNSKTKKAQFVDLGAPAAPSGKTAASAGVSCKKIKEENPSAANGIYYVTAGGSPEKTFCLMDSSADGGGWTLVGSVHEDNRNARGNSNDRWSSTTGYTTNNGNDAGPPFWCDDRTHGSPESAARDDFKIKAFTKMNAAKMMVMTVENGKDYSQFWSSAWLVQTGSPFGSVSPNNFKGMCNKYTMRFRYRNFGGCGPGNVPVKYIKGSSSTLYSNMCPNCRRELTSNQWSFVQRNCEASTFMFCQAGRRSGCSTSNCNIEHHCLGSSYVHGHSLASTGDHVGWDWHYLGSGWNSGWTSTKKYYESATLFLYRE